MLFGLKCLCGIALWAIYTYYYTDRMTADIYKYFDDAKILHDVALTDFGLYLKIFLNIGDQSPEVLEVLNRLNFWNKSYNYGILNDNQTIIRIQSIMHFLSFGHFHVHNILFNLMSFTGLVGLYHFFKKYFALDKWVLILSVFLIPSVLFWGSGVLKDALLIFSLGMFLYFLFVRRWGVMRFIWLIIFGLLLVVIKSYVVLTILPGALLILLSRKVKWKPLVAYGVLALIGLIIVVIGSYTNIYDGLGYLLLKQKDFFNQAALSGSGSLYDIPKLEDRIDIFLYGPLAVINVLFRPMLWEVRSPFYLLSAMENLFLIITLIGAFIFRKKIKWNNQWAIFNWSFVILLAALIGLVTPVLGAVVRYKIPLLPFLFVAIFFIVDFHKFYDKLPLFKKLRDI